MYRDGVHALRCHACGQTLRDGGDAPVVYVTITAIEEAIIALPEDCDTLRHEFEQRVGRTHMQIVADRARKSLEPADPPPTYTSNSLFGDDV